MAVTTKAGGQISNAIIVVKMVILQEIAQSHLKDVIPEREVVVMAGVAEDLTLNATIVTTWVILLEIALSQNAIEMIDDQKEDQGPGLEADQEAQEEGQEVGLSPTPEIIEKTVEEILEEIDVEAPVRNPAEDPGADPLAPKVEPVVAPIKNLPGVEARPQEAEPLKRKLRGKDQTKNQTKNLKADQDQDLEDLEDLGHLDNLSFIVERGGSLNC